MVLPPSITEFGLLCAGRERRRKFNRRGQYLRQISSPRITLFEIGIPVDHPRHRSQFKVTSQMDATSELKPQCGRWPELQPQWRHFVFPPQPFGRNGSRQAKRILPFLLLLIAAASVPHILPPEARSPPAQTRRSIVNLFLNLDAQADFVRDGQFFDLFNSSVGTSLFNKDFPLFQKCFTSANSSSTALPSTVTLSNSKRRHYSPRARLGHPALLFGGSFHPLHAKRVGLAARKFEK
ncbi:hypothetical protein BJV77DRAFT_1074502 [Russula vinacea]|nr:hypothetical protein BJV77DRAFT_1074502 [Russula vinacea]